MIKTAVILAAGLGKRFAPLSQIITKELLPLGRKPLLDWLIEEIAQAGVTEVVLVSSPQKRLLVQHFYSLAHEYGLGAEAAYQEILLGTADALLKAQEFLRRKSFLVYYGDELWLGEPSRTQQLQEAYDRLIRPVCAVAWITDQKLLAQMGVIKPYREIYPGLYTVEHVVEKPALGKAPSDLALVSGMVLDSSIFETLEKVIHPATDAREVYLSEVLDPLCRTATVYALELKGERVDVGTLERYPFAFVQMALADPTVGEEFRGYLRRVISEEAPSEEDEETRRV